MVTTQTASAPTPLPHHVTVFVIGAGFAGLGTAIKLQESGLTDFLVVDRGDDVGGTWRDNTYPGAACDVPSQLYSFSFAPNPHWTRSFSPQREIQAYLQRVARESGTLDRFRFGTTVEQAAWDDEARAWTVTTSAGTVLADVLVTGSGGLSEPKLPEIAGIDSLAGEVFHSSRWNHDYDLTGKRVAVIGTGASAIQIVPAIAERVGHLDVYQRTAPWVMPRSDRAYTAVERLGFRFLPGLQRLYRTGVYWGREGYVPAFTLAPALAAPAEKIAARHIASGISDPALRAQVTPDYRLGCKRVLISNDYYPALDRDDVDLVTDGIREITPTGIVTADGTEREVDCLIVATGFHTTDQPIAHHLKGSDGRSLADAWRESGMMAYKGTTVAGFPNLFQIVGPNTGLGHSSMVFVIESQIAYILGALRALGELGLASIEPRADAQAVWNEALHKRMARTVWSTGGCSSWYLDEHGRNTVLWPRSTFTLRRQLGSFDPDAYVVTARDAPTSKEDVA